MNSPIAYVDFECNCPVQDSKLQGIRRYADAIGWEVVVIPVEESRPDGLRRTLERLKPVGCVVESSAGRRDLPPSFFGSTPVVYLDGWQTMYGGRALMIVHDNESTARKAFGELAATRPSAFAVVGWPSPLWWSQIRERTFCERVAVAGMKCHVFRTRQADPAERSRRLETWLGCLPERCAVFAINDRVAADVAEVCRRIGRRLPSDLTLLGVDNVETLCGPLDISSIQIDFEQAGYKAMEMLGEVILYGYARKTKETFGSLLAFRRRSTGGRGLQSASILKAVDLIRREACNGLRARDVIRSVGGSRRSVETRFHGAVGHTILREIESVRLSRAIQLLRNPELPLEQVAVRSGFPSVPALRKAFRLAMGTSLLKWRRNNKR